jgi:hypothetical protein
MSLTVKNWRVFQHYKDRSPPWIKLQKTLLDDFVFQRLPLASKALAPMLWLLASESDDGSLPSSVEEIAFRLRWPEKDISAGIKPLIEKGFLIDASSPLADCKQVATSETEGETETECASAPVLPPDLDPKAWSDWIEYRASIRKPLKPASHPKAMRALAKFGKGQSAVVDQSIAQGWAGLFDLKPGATTTPKADPYARAI